MDRSRWTYLATIDPADFFLVLINPFVGRNVAPCHVADELLILIFSNIEQDQQGRKFNTLCFGASVPYRTMVIYFIVKGGRSKRSERERYYLAHLLTRDST